jgi:hypothetical protein
MKFEIKKLHEMISSIPIGIAPLSEWNYRSSNKPFKLAQMTLDELYNKSHEGFVEQILGKYPNWPKTLV